MLRISPVIHIGQNLPKKRVQIIETAKPKVEQAESFQSILSRAMEKNQTR